MRNYLLHPKAKNGGAMKKSLSPVQGTVEKLDEELASLKDQMATLTVEQLRRLRDAGAIEYAEERLLERYEACMWLRYGVA